jgi:hypothetical protein
MNRGERGWECPTFDRPQTSYTCNGSNPRLLPPSTDMPAAPARMAEPACPARLGAAQPDPTPRVGRACGRPELRESAQVDPIQVHDRPGREDTCGDAPGWHPTPADRRRATSPPAHSARRCSSNRAIDTQPAGAARPDVAARPVRRQLQRIEGLHVGLLPSLEDHRGGARRRFGWSPPGAGVFACGLALLGHFGPRRVGNAGLLGALGGKGHLDTNIALGLAQALARRGEPCGQRRGAG